MENRINYRPAVSRERIVWPNQTRIAFSVGINIEYYDIDRPNPRMPEAHRPDMIAHVWHEYGSRVGIFRMMDMLDKHHMRASVLLNAEVCERHPQIIEQAMKRGWEWLGHGITNQRNMPSCLPTKKMKNVR